MSVKTKRFFKRLIGYAGLFFFVLAAGMLYWQLRNYSLMDILRSLWHIPFANLVMASIACFVGYVALSLYDYLALEYVGRKVSWWKWMLAGMLGFAISNNAGSAAVSGGAIRYRLYTRWRVPGADIIKMITFSGLTFFLGYAAVAVIGYFLVPHEILQDSVSIGITGLFIACLSLILAYYAIAIVFCDKSIRIGEIKFHIPSIGTATVQTFLGIMDALCAGLVLYFCLIPYVPDLPFGMFMGLYVIAAVAGVFSQTPGGIGVFESIFLIALPKIVPSGNVNEASVFGALLAYRIIYYVLPLIGVGGLFFIYERWLRARMKRWLEEAKHKMPKLPIHHKNNNLDS